MSIEEKVDYYFEKIKKRRKRIFGNPQIIKQGLKDIIEANHENVLTDAFLYNVSGHYGSTDLGNTLLSLSDYNILLSTVIRDISGSLIVYRSVDEMENLTDYEKELMKNCFKAIDFIKNDNRVIEKDYTLMKNIVKTITAYMFVNNIELSKFDQLLNPYLTDPIERIDELVVQGICKESYVSYYGRYEYIYNTGDLINYIIFKSEENVYREIR